MNKSRSWKRAAVAANFLFLTTLPSLALGQSAPPVTPQSRQMSTLQPAPRASNQPMDIFAGLTYTEEQKAKIERIQQSSRTRMEAVVKDEKLNPDQKRAMLDGL